MVAPMPAFSTVLMYGYEKVLAVTQPLKPDRTPGPLEANSIFRLFFVLALGTN